MKGDHIAGHLAWFRKEFGEQISYNGVTLWATPRPLEPREREFLPDGVDRNAAFTDLRAYSLTPSDLKDPAAEGDAVVAGGRNFTVIAVPLARNIGGVRVKQRVLVYRTPPTGSDSADPNTGERADYLPPDSTL